MKKCVLNFCRTPTIKQRQIECSVFFYWTTSDKLIHKVITFSYGKGRLKNLHDVCLFDLSFHKATIEVFISEEIQDFDVLFQYMKRLLSDVGQLRYLINNLGDIVFSSLELASFASSAEYIPNCLVYILVHHSENILYPK